MKNKAFRVFAASMAVLFGLICIACDSSSVGEEGYTSDEDEQQYYEACQALDNGEYLIAYYYFSELGTYKDAKEKTIESGQKYMEEAIAIVREDPSLAEQEYDAFQEVMAGVSDCIDEDDTEAKKELAKLYMSWCNVAASFMASREANEQMEQALQNQNYVQAAAAYEEGSLTNVDEYQKKLFDTINNIGGWYMNADKCIGGSNWLVDTNQAKGCVTVSLGMEEYELYLQNYGAERIRFVGDGMELYDYHYGNGIETLMVKCPECNRTHEIFAT